METNERPPCSGLSDKKQLEQQGCPVFPNPRDCKFFNSSKCPLAYQQHERSSGS